VVVLAGLVVLAAILAPPQASGEGKPRKPRLQLLILANGVDEPKAVEAAKRHFADAKKDAKRQQELQSRATEGLPPPPVAVATDKASGCTWVEVGPSQLRTMRLEKETAGGGGALWRKVADARAKGEAVTVLEQCLLYSRPCVNRTLSRRSVPAESSTTSS
jgi:hypothetical protein